VDFSVQALGDLFGLQGYTVQLQGVPLGGTFVNAPVNSSGELTALLLAGNTYSLDIRQGANIQAFLGTRNAEMFGTFDFSLVPTPIPEPATLLLFGTTAAGLGLARWRRNRSKRQAQEGPE
jgi:hypothetical protein